MGTASAERPRSISVRGAREHNLRAVDVELPRGALTVVTGVSGSGKSSLAFDTIGAEGRRRYLETFSSYARQFLGKLARPALSQIDGLSPAVILDQGSVARSPRSTVGTMSELYDLLRLLFARSASAPPGLELPPRTRALFSFNTKEGACPACKGLGVEDRLDPELLVAHPERSVREGALRITTPTGYLIYSQVTLEVLDQVCRAHGFSVDLPWSALSDEQRRVILYGSDRIRIPYGKHPLSSRLRWSGITARPREEGTYKGILPVMEQILRQKRNRNILRFVRTLPCGACRGTRLRPEALAYTLRGRSIAELAALGVTALSDFFAALDRDAVEQAIGREGRSRCEVLGALGLGYLTLDRESTSLSGGEAHRLQLARQAQGALGGVLYVLDEPSLGLHHEDTGRLLALLRRLRDAGNTVLCVEHDEQVIRAADWLVDLGPGAGEAGGLVLHSGPAPLLSAEPCPQGLERSRTRAFLTGRERIALPARRRAGRGLLVAAGLTRHSLHEVTAELSVGAFNVVSGVSGSGKSTLVGELVRALREGRAELPAGERIDKVIEIDQAPIGRTPRSNPATYTGCFDRIRELYAAEPEARRRGFGKGRFSFNVEGGRCEACEGAGVQQIGMQFLGSVSVVCEACGGRRFNDETLEIRWRGRRIDEVLSMPVSEAAALFADEPAVARHLELLSRLGLGYLGLGHPATMLSGGEAQRVKLAAELARPGTGRTLYVLDEPTAGLHSADVLLLLAALEGLLEQGNTILCVEHHLDVIKVADRVLDLGPGSGEAGGRIVVAGTPEEVAACGASRTGAALREHLHAGPERAALPAAGLTAREPQPIRLVNVTTHNLRHVDVELPAGRLTVVTGVSGSGKSSLAFDTLFAEGQRRFAESFTTYARRFLRLAEEGELERASGLTPTIAIRQQAPSRNPRSSVGTATEIHDHYRLLYARAGTRHCPRCGLVLEAGRCRCGFAGAAALSAASFSSSSRQGACPRCDGLGQVVACDPAKLVTDPSRPLAGGALAGHAPGRFYGDPHGQHLATLAAAARARGLDLSLPWSELDERARALALHGAGDERFEVVWDYVRGARRGSHRFQAPWPGLLELVRQEYLRKHADDRAGALLPLMAEGPCPECAGGKLRPEPLAVRLAGESIAALAARSVDESLAFFARLEAGGLDARALALTRELRAEVTRRLASLRDAGLGYLALDRPLASLSGGEAQRVRLASQLRSGLTGVTYVLDEPTVGLHPRDTGRLLGLLRELRDAGNTVVVVEHDLEVIAAADHLIEVGPGAGPEGGQIVAAGTPAEVARDPASPTGRALARATAAPGARAGRELRPGLTLRGAAAHNLQGFDLELPAGGLTVVTGVSGSGKTSLVFELVGASLARALEAGPGRPWSPAGCRELVLHAPWRTVVGLEQQGLAPSPRSSAATQLGILDRLRELYAASEDARARGLGKKHFSTQAPGGRCERCEGLGQVKIGMDFLPDVWVPCEACGGTRYGPEVLACKLLGHSIAELLELGVEEARALLAGDPLPGKGAARRVASIRSALDVLSEVGLGYLRLGQPTRALSGGERQRLLLATALGERGEGPSLYLLDEPTVGLHPEDVAQLLEVFGRLLDAGHTLVVVEHNLDLVRAADWVVDLGPEGGPAGGRIVAAGPLEAIVACPESWTGRALAAAARGASA